MHAGDDVADEETVLRDLRASEARYRALVLATSQMVWRTAPDGTVLHNTDAWQLSTGQSQQDSSGWGWLDVVHPEDRPGTVAVWSQCLRDVAPYEHSYRILVEGRWRWILARAVPVRGDGGGVQEWVGTTIDVHDAREAESERERLLEELRSALRRVTLLQGLTAELVAATSPDAVVDRLVPFLRTAAGANTVALFAPERDGLRLVGHAGYPDWAAGAFARVPSDAPVPIARAVRHGRRIAVTAASAEDDVVREILRTTGNRLMVAAPLLAGGAQAGALALGFADREELDDDTSELLDAIFGQVAQALQRVSADVRLQDVAVGLQRQLSPSLLPTVPGIELAADYRAGGDAVELVGGDWYDVVPVDRDRLLVVVGDVMGRGVAAATTMASTSAAVRALALVEPDPAALVTRLDAYVSAHSPDQFITLFCGLLDVRSGVLRFLLAGHVPPLLLREGRCAPLAAPAQPPMGLAAGPRSSTEVALGPHEVLVVVTDGVVEVPGSDIDDGLERACAAAADGEADAAAVVTRVASLARATDDDATVLAVRVLGATPEAGRRDS